MTDNNNKQLSKGLSEMKFMKKSIDLQHQQDLEKTKRQELLSSQWSLLQNQKLSVKLKQESSFLPLLNSKTSLGRVSFQSFNPAMEELAKEKALESIRESDISNKEMALEMGGHLKRKSKEPIEYPIGKHSRFSLLTNKSLSSSPASLSTKQESSDHLERTYHPMNS